MHPSYTGSYVRLATISRDVGALEHSNEWLKHALKVSNDNSELLSLIGHFWLESGEYEMSQKIYERLLNEGQSFMVPYAQISLGNIYFANVKNCPPERRGNLLKYAVMFYKKALKSDNSNVFAASGIGCVLAETGQVDKAKDVFQRVRECSNDAITSTFLNLAHVLLAKGSHAPAISMYQNYLKRDSSSGVDVCTFIAHAYFNWAKFSESSSSMAEADKMDERYNKALEWLEKARLADPASHDTKFNLALTRMDFAVGVMSKSSKGLKRTLKDVEAAVENLNISREAFSVLSKVEKSKGDHFPVRSCEDYAQYCEERIEECEAHVTFEKEREDYESKKREQQVADARELEISNRIKKLEEEGRLAREEEEMHKLAMTFDHKAKELSEIMKQKEQTQSASKKRKANDDYDRVNDFSDDEGPVAGDIVDGGGARNASGGSAPSGDLLFGPDSDSSDDEAAAIPVATDEESKEEPKPKSTVAALFDSDSDDDDDDDEGGNDDSAEAGNKEDSPPKRRKMVIDEEEDE